MASNTRSSPFIYFFIYLFFTEIANAMLPVIPGGAQGVTGCGVIGVWVVGELQ